jgi:hypothetical protein
VKGHPFTDSRFGERVLNVRSLAGRLDRGNPQLLWGITRMSSMQALFARCAMSALADGDPRTAFGLSPTDARPPKRHNATELDAANWL